MGTTKDARLNVRISQAEDELIRVAADALGLSVSEFLTSSAIRRAHDVIADQRHFVLDAESWDAFVAVLDQPVRADPALVELFARPSRIKR